MINECEYFGIKKENQVGGLFVDVREINNEEITSYRLKHIERHSPDGFQWGYGGSGPADLALSILTDFCEKNNIPKHVAENHYQEFKNDFIVGLKNILNISGKDIYNWLIDKNIILNGVIS